MAKTVDPVVQLIERLPDAQREIAHVLRAVIRRAAPALAESIKWGNPCYAATGNVCAIIPYPGLFT